MLNSEFLSSKEADVGHEGREKFSDESVGRDRTMNIHDYSRQEESKAEAVREQPVKVKLKKKKSVTFTDDVDAPAEMYGPPLRDSEPDFDVRTDEEHGSAYQFGAGNLTNAAQGLNKMQRMKGGVGQHGRKRSTRSSRASSSRDLESTPVTFQRMSLNRREVIVAADDEGKVDEEDEDGSEEYHTSDGSAEA